MNGCMTRCVFYLTIIVAMIMLTKPPLLVAHVNVVFAIIKLVNSINIGVT